MDRFVRRTGTLAVLAGVMAALWASNAKASVRPASQGELALATGGVCAPCCMRNVSPCTYAPPKVITCVTENGMCSEATDAQLCAITLGTKNKDDACPAKGANTTCSLKSLSNMCVPVVKKQCWSNAMLHICVCANPIEGNEGDLQRCTEDSDPCP